MKTGPRLRFLEPNGLNILVHSCIINPGVSKKRENDPESVGLRFGLSYSLDVWIVIRDLTEALLLIMLLLCYYVNCVQLKRKTKADVYEGKYVEKCESFWAIPCHFNQFGLISHLNFYFYVLEFRM